MTTSTTQTLRHFVNSQRITASAEWADRNPNADDDAWARTANHYRVTLRRPGHRLTVYFSMGPALTAEPTAEDVLNSLALDASGVENARGSFEDWAGEYGYDTDSRKAERTFRITERQTAKLRAFLGEDAFDQLVWHTENL